MVPVEVLDEHDDVQGECDDDRVDLAAGREEVDHLLDRAGAVHVQRDVDEFLCDRLADDVPLLVRRVLKQLLAEVVPEGI